MTTHDPHDEPGDRGDQHRDHDDRSREDTSAPRPTRARRGDHRDPSHDHEKVVGDHAADALPPPTKDGYRPRSTGRIPPDEVRRAAERNRAVTPRLGPARVTAATEEQYRQAVRLLAAMIVSWVQRDRDEPPEPSE
ncbi:MAG: hypothetical protein HYR62_02680 [Actinobacteria bacterium]|nr:hypothetical protein [Actinomycetota bacterium]MBI3687378.1 hypothetical protein [Actinomycetota bacterium]